MQSSRRPKTLMDADRHTLEFSSGQLIIAICGLLFLWLVGFLMGVMAGRLEFGGTTVAELTSPLTKPAAATAKPDGAKAAAPAPKAPSGTNTSEKGRTRVANIAVPPAPGKAAPAPTKPADKPAQPAPAESAAPKFVADRPSRAATQTQAEAAANPAPAKEQPAPAAPATPAQPPAATPTPPAAEPTAVAKVEAAAPAEKPAAEAPKVEEKPAETAAAPAPGGKGFAVQVFSVKAANRANADEYVALLKENSGLEGRVIKSKDGKLYQVVIGNYADRKAAEKKRDELKKKAGFADCIVREVGP